MKKTITIIFAVLSATMLSARANYDDIAAPPAAVEAAFSQMYPNATRVEWEKEHGRYEAEFYIDLSEKEAIFKADGTWLRTKTEISPADAPAAATQAVKDKYPQWVIDDIDFYEDASLGEFYLFEIEKGSLDKHIKVRADGSLL